MLHLHVKILNFKIEKYSIFILKMLNVFPREKCLITLRNKFPFEINMTVFTFFHLFRNTKNGISSGTQKSKT